MDRVNVELKVFGKKYPLKFKESDLHLFYEAQNELDAQLEFYKNKGVQDKQDLLVMILFDSIINKLMSKNQFENEVNSVVQSLDGIIAQLDT